MPKPNDQASEPSAKEKLYLLLLGHVLGIREVRALLVFLLMTAFFAYLTGGKFVSVSSVTNMLRYVSAYGVMAGGVTLLLISGEIDISTGSIFPLTAIIAALLVKNIPGFSIWLAAPVAIAIAGLCGLVNGVVTVKGGIPSFIATIGTMLIYRALGYILSGGVWLSGMPPSRFYTIMGGKVLGLIPVGIFWFVGVILCLWILLEKTAFGNRTFATGNNKEAARMTGINTDRVKITNFIITACLAGFAGILYFSHFGSILPIEGMGAPLDTIGAAVVGGTSLFGGAGGVIGTLVGVFIIAGARIGFVLARLGGYWANILVGSLIIVAVIVNLWLERRVR